MSAIKIEAVEAAQAMARQQGLDIGGAQMMLILEAFLSAGGYELPWQDADPQAERTKLFDGYSRLKSIRMRISLIEEEAALLPEAYGDWQYKNLFDHLFEGNGCASDEIRAVLEDIGRTFPDYFDPDTTYKEDAQAYIGAVDEMIEGIRQELSEEIDPEETNCPAV